MEGFGFRVSGTVGFRDFGISGFRGFRGFRDFGFRDFGISGTVYSTPKPHPRPSPSHTLAIEDGIRSHF